MRKTEQYKETTEHTYTRTIDITCNKCGRSCKTKTAYKYFCLLCYTGTDANKFGKRSLKLEMCPECFEQFLKTLPIQPSVVT